jgi:hypothetical protein
MNTATLLKLGPVEAEPTFGHVVVLTDRRESLIAGARTVIDQWAGSGILLVVTHGANIHALESVPPASGEIRRGTKRKRWPQRTARPPES